MSLEVNEKYIKVPRVTTTERNALTAANGMLVYDTTLNAFYKYENGAWSAFAGGNFVTLDTDQTITGLKDFENGMTLTPQATPTYERGRVYFDDTNDCLAFMDSISGTSVQVGYEVLMRARNNTGSQINNGQVVYINGSLGTNSTVALAQANAEATSLIIGVATHDIANNSTGKIVVFGLANNLDTSSFTDGQEIFLSSTVAGGLTSTPPASPNFVVRIGIVERAHATQGKILVKPEITTANNNSLGTSQRVAPTQNSVKTYVDTETAKRGYSLNGGIYVSLGASTTSFTLVDGLSSASTENLRQNIMPNAGTFSNASIYSEGQPATGSFVVTLRKNGADTAIVITIAAGSGAGKYYDNTNTVTFVQGDLMSWRLANNASSAATTRGISIRAIQTS